MTRDPDHEPRKKQRAKAVRLALSLLFPFFVLGSVIGCRSRGDLVEAELRTRDRELVEMRDELRRIQMCNDGLQREIRALRRNSSSKVPPEDSTLVFSLKSISLGRQTGGYDADQSAGDDALQVVLEPRDVDNHLIKAPGTLDVRALEVNEEGLKKPFCSWQLTPEQLRRTWRTGILTTGYFIVLPWKSWPTSEKLRVVAVFTLADGRTFEADRDVTVKMTPAARRKPEPAEPVTPPPALEQTPPPRRVGSVNAMTLHESVRMLKPQPRK